MEQKISITIQTTVAASAQQTWDCFNKPEHVMQWNHASEDWHCPAAVNDLRVGGSFNYTMAAKDGSFQFGFGGVYDEIIPLQLIRYTLGDNRKVEVHFTSDGSNTSITETFEAENMHSPELQQQGWQAILNNFKAYTEERKNE